MTCNHFWTIPIRGICECLKCHERVEVKSGECELCGEYSGALIDAMCAPCREKYAPDEIARRAGV